MEYTAKQREIARKIVEQQDHQFGGYIYLDENAEEAAHVVVTCTPQQMIKFAEKFGLTDELLPHPVNFWGWFVDDVCENLFELHPEQAEELYPGCMEV